MANTHSQPEERFWRDLHHADSRRKDPRVHANVSVSLTPPKGSRIKLISNDLSYHGMQVRCDRSTAAALRPHSHGEKAHPTYASTLRLEIDGIKYRVRAKARLAHLTLVADAAPESEVAIGMMFLSFEDGAQDVLSHFIEQHLLPAD